MFSSASFASSAVDPVPLSSPYIELHAASAFSFLQGASLPEALVDRAAALGYPALALLDRDGVYGAPRFHKAALAAGVRPIIGAELTIGAGEAGGGGGGAFPPLFVFLLFGKHGGHRPPWPPSTPPEKSAAERG